MEYNISGEKDGVLEKRKEEAEREKGTVTSGNEGGNS
jgi:hypothetical protein